METTVPLIIGVVSLLLLGLGALGDDRRARARRRAANKIELPLLHSINDDRCIGCEACVDVCPTEVLDLVDHKVRVVRFSDCVQCEQCANACPTTALVMYRQGGTPQTLTVPELDEHFMTGVPGQYLIGEVAGKPLVKNAANLGRAVIEHIARDLAGKPSPGNDVLDVAIVGSGPGGLSAGLTCLVKRLSCVVIEKEHAMASTVARYPKGKLFMAEPADSGNLSYLPVFDASKEELVAAWTQVAEGAKLPVKLGEAVETVKRGDDGIFTIKSTVATYRARTVVLATGLRGKPRLLAVPGANLEKVKSRLDDPDAFGGQHVLVVGGGDSAVEASMSLSDAGATVTLSYRGDGFKRCKQGNQKRLAELSSAQKVTVLLESNVKEFTADAVTITLKSGEVTTLPNHHAFVLIGADTPVVWLEANNVRFVEREHLYALGSTEDVVKRVVPDAAECSKVPAEALAIILGRPSKPARPSRPAQPSLPARPARPARPERSVVSLIRDEFQQAVREVTGVFKLSDLEEIDAHTPRPTRPALRTGGTAHARPRKEHSQLIPAAELVRPAPTKLFAHHDAQHPYTPVNTTVEILSLPEQLRRAGKPVPPEFDLLERTSAKARAFHGDATATKTRAFAGDATATTARTFADATQAQPFGGDATSTKTRVFDDDATSAAAPVFDHPDTGTKNGTTPETPALRRPPPPMKASADIAGPIRPTQRSMGVAGEVLTAESSRRPGSPPPPPPAAKQAQPPLPPSRLPTGTTPPPDTGSPPRVRPPARIVRKRTQR